MDYRYFPDPDIPPLLVSGEWIERVRAQIPELPQALRARFIAQYALTPKEASFLTLERPLADFFETAAKDSGNPRAASAWVANELMGRLNAAGKTIDASPVSAAAMGSLIRLIDDQTISGKIAKTVFDEMFTAGAQPGDIVSRKGLTQITDEASIAAIVDQVIAANSGQAEQYRAGKTAALGWFVGQVMKASGGKANPALVNRILKEKLGS
jgi:aspartyl-tRNA(Asn)/glutamyl-tRNA(Gln) amidotransferase subunit B